MYLHSKSRVANTSARLQFASVDGHLLAMVVVFLTNSFSITIPAQLACCFGSTLDSLKMTFHLNHASLFVNRHMSLYVNYRVEDIGVEPMTSCVQGRRSSQLS